MIRRQFLARALSAAVASMFARKVFAQHDARSMHGMRGASDMPDMADMHDMQGTHDMHDMQGMPPMSAHREPASTAANLAAPDALPAGGPLAALRTLANESREPGMFRATLVAQPVRRQLLAGKPATLFWQYDQARGNSGTVQTNGPVVGPLIDVREGDTVEIRFVNRLPQASTIHWHGLPVPPDQDGNPSAPVAPGASHVYRFTLPPGSAGTYWYHPHPHMTSAEQVFRGLAGPLVVRAADDPLAGWPERHLFITDLKLAADGTIAPNEMMDWMNGREGQFVLVNGARLPRIVVTADERWRVWNGSNARYLRLSLDEARTDGRTDGRTEKRTFTQVGTDGGLLEAPREGLTELLLAPGERVELVVRAGTQPARAQLMALTYDRRKMAMPHGNLPPDSARALADLRFEPQLAAAPADNPRALPAKLRAIESLGAPAAKKSVVFSEDMDMSAMHRAGASAHGMPAGMTFMINGARFDPSRTTLTSRSGDVELWSIVNRTDMDHPFHLHGTQFQVVDRAWRGKVMPEPWRAWRDTVNVRPGETVRIATVQRMAGQRMFHCHILEHEDLGMMGTLKVI